MNAKELSSVWIVRGFSQKNGDLCYLTEAENEAEAIENCATNMDKQVVFEDGFYICDLGMTNNELLSELDNNLGSPRRSYKASAVPAKLDTNLA